jgi:uncharacterized protein
MRFAITGATGLVGGEISRQLKAAGHEVTPVVRSFSGMDHAERGVVWHPERGAIEREGLEGHDVVIHLAGESLAGVWTAAKRRRILESRVDGTTLLSQTVAGLDRPPRVLFSASGFNIYGDRGQEDVDESAPPGDGFLPNVARAWESSTTPASAAGIRVVTMRFGTVMSPRGGMLGTLIPLFRLGLGAAIGDGRQYMPWIALEDIPRAILHLLERPEVAGPVNFVTPNPVTNQEFTDALAGALRRPAFFRLPGFAASLAPGDMVNEMMVASVKAVPAKLHETGFEWQYPRLREALDVMLGD